MKPKACTSTDPRTTTGHRSPTMPLFRRLHRRLSWIALFAMLAMALAPTVSHALADAPAPWLAVCSATGTSPNGVAGEPTQLPGLAHLDHCPFCALQGAAPPPPPALALWRPMDLSQAMPESYGQAHHPSFAWCAAQPRAPPPLS